MQEQKSDTWVGRITESIRALIEKGGTPEVALVLPAVYDKVEEEIADYVEYGYKGQRSGIDRGTFIIVDSWQVEIISELYLPWSVLVGERAGLLPETEVSYA